MGNDLVHDENLGSSWVQLLLNLGACKEKYICLSMGNEEGGEGYRQEYFLALVKAQMEAMIA